jgi:uncharacterized protein with NRDE domain
MCLVVVAFRVSGETPLVVAANRDEFHGRPTREAHAWTDAPGVFAGRDLQAGGTWLGIHRSGRFATVTNFRDAEPPSGDLQSRGRLVAGFLTGRKSPAEYLDTIDGDAFAGFNLLLSDGDTLAYLSNRGGGQRELEPGIYGLSNATLDTPWEKVERSKAQLAGLLGSGNVDDVALLNLLADREKGPVEEVRDERLPFATAHAITAPFIITPEYGTRCSTIVRADASGRWHFLERRFDPDGQSTGESRFLVGDAEDGQ